MSSILRVLKYVRSKLIGSRKCTYDIMLPAFICVLQLHSQMFIFSSSLMQYHSVSAFAPEDHETFLEWNLIIGFWKQVTENLSNKLIIAAESNFCPRLLSNIKCPSYRINNCSLLLTMISVFRIEFYKASVGG